MQKIIPHLWYDKQAKEAANFYVSVFGGDSALVSTSVLRDTPSGDCDLVSFKLWGYSFMAISAGPYFTFNPAISISVQCANEEEIIRIHKFIKEGGRDLMPLDTYPWSKKYAWIADKYGLSWQLNLPNDQSAISQRINPALLFTKDVCGRAEEAMNFYASVFPNSRIHFVGRYQKGQEPDKEGTVAHAEFDLNGELMMALDSAREHVFTFNEAVSLLVSCKDQAEIDYYWNKLSAVPEAEQCGWLKDKFGVSWQIVPYNMNELMSKNPEKTTPIMLKMKKIIIADLENTNG